MTMKSNNLEDMRRRLRIYRDRLREWVREADSTAGLAHTLASSHMVSLYRENINNLEAEIAVQELLEEVAARQEVHIYNLEFDSLARVLETIRDPDVIVHSLETTWKVTGWLWWKRKVKIWKVKISYR